MPGLTALKELPLAWKVAGAALTALAIIIFLAAFGAWSYHKGAAGCEASVAKATAKLQKEKDDLANELVIAQAQAMATNEKTVTVFKDRIIHAPSTSTCGPVLRDAADGVCALVSGGGPNAKCNAPAAVH